MNGDEPVAGPSSQPITARSIFLAPPAQAASDTEERISQNLRSTHDLLSKFRLKDAYDKYVRAEIQQPGFQPSDKGKGKEVATTAPDNTDDLEDDKKKKNSYKHLIKGVPGKHSTKKDDYLTTIIQVPPKQRTRITPFDRKTQREAFEVSLEGLKGWNANTLILESAQAREDRKKRKELKRLAKQQQAQAQAAMAASTPTPIPHPSTPLPQSSPTPRPAGVGTPRPQPSPRPSSTKPALPPVTVPSPGARAGTPLRTGTPTGPHPLSAPPLSAGALPPSAGLPNAASMAQQQQRGKKREREDAPPLNGTASPSTNLAAAPPNGIHPAPVINARAGNSAARPRPVKKQRVDIDGQARESVPVQQPTPQGT